MKRLWLLLLGVVLLVPIGFGGFAVFEHFDRAGKVRDAAKACTGLDTVTPGASVPAGFALPNGQTLMHTVTQGKATVLFASAPGSRADLVAVRDQLAQALVGQGYTLGHKDQEPTYEADVTLSRGGKDDSINVRPLCAGKLVVRYTLNG